MGGYLPTCPPRVDHGIAKQSRSVSFRSMALPTDLTIFNISVWVTDTLAYKRKGERNDTSQTTNHLMRLLMEYYLY